MFGLMDSDLRQQINTLGGWDGWFGGECYG